MFSWPRGMWTGVQKTQVLTLGPPSSAPAPKKGSLLEIPTRLQFQLAGLASSPTALVETSVSFLPFSFLVPFPPLFVCLFLFPFFLPNPIILQFLPPSISSSPGRRYHVKFNLYAQHNVYFIITKLSICICIIKV